MTFDYLIRLRANMNLNFFIVNSIAIPSNTDSPLAQQIINLSGMLTMQDEDFAKMTKDLGCKTKKLNMRQRIRITAELDALAAHHYGLDRKQYEYIVQTFGQNQHGGNLDDASEWNDDTIRIFNHEVRKQVMKFYDTQTSM